MTIAGKAGELNWSGELACERGATFDGSLAFADDNGQPIDLTGFTIVWQVRRKYDDEQVVLDIAAHCTVSDPTNGVVLFAVPPSVTEELPIGTHVTDFLLAQGDYGQFQFRGAFQVTSTVSRAA